jgi:uncharacterized protein YdeI (BOF family)
MKSLHVLVALLAVMVTGSLAQDKKGNDPQTTTSEQTACHGTAVEFVDTPVKAAKLAAEQKKLVMVLHVSGYFEDPEFT